MAKTRYLYEILVRGRADKGLAAAHVVYAEQYTDDETGAVVAEQMLPAQPFDVAAVESLVGTEFAGLTRQIADQIGHTADLQAQLDAALSEVATLRQDNGALAAAHTLLREQIAVATAKAAQMEDEIARLQVPPTMEASPPEI